MSIIESNNAGIRSVIEEWFRKYVANNVHPNVVKIAGKFSHIDVKGDVVIENYQEVELPFYIKFGEIKGNFTCSSSKLLSMSGFPRKVSNDFTCKDCPNITSLTGMPTYIGGNCDIHNCGMNCSEYDIMTICDVTGNVYC